MKLHVQFNECMGIEKFIVSHDRSTLTFKFIQLVDMLAAKYLLIFLDFLAHTTPLPIFQATEVCLCFVIKTMSFEQVCTACQL